MLLNRIHRRAKNYLRMLQRYSYYRLKTDALIYAFPKSGSTWLRFFMSEYLSRVAKQRVSQDFDVEISNVPSLFFSHTGFFPRGDQSLLMSKINIERVLDKEFKKNNKKKKIFLFRDPRDVVVSYYFHITSPHYINRSSFAGTISDFALHSSYGIDGIVTYMNICASYALQDKNTFIFEYEQLSQAPVDTFRKIITFLGIELDEVVLLETVEYCSFENMNSLEKKHKLKHKSFQASKMDDDSSLRVRRGKVSGYLDYFSSQEVEQLNKKMELLDAYFHSYK